MRNYCCRFINIIRENFMVPVYRVQSTDVAGGPVRRSRTFVVSQKRQKQNRRFCRDAVRPPDEAHPEAARLAAAYDLQGPRYGQTVSAETSCPSVQGPPRPQLRITNYELKSPAGALHLLLYRSSSLECLCQRHLVGIFKLRTDRYTVGKTAYGDSHRL